MNKLQAAVDTQEKTIKSLKSQLELLKGKQIEVSPPCIQSTTDPSDSEAYLQSVEAELEELKKDYTLIEVNADEALDESSKEN